MLLSAAMIEEFAESFLCDVQKLKDENWNIGEQDWIHRSYPHFIQFFDTKEPLKEHDVMIGRFLVYGWMPTILRKLGDSSKENDLIEYLKKVKNHEEPSLMPEEIEHISSYINNSVIGTSKLLHFINPRIYAIWDKWVCRYLHENNPILNKNGMRFPKNIPGNSGINSRLYKQYLTIIYELSKNDKLCSYKKSFEKKVTKYEVSCVRFAEYVMYSSAKQSEDKK